MKKISSILMILSAALLCAVSCKEPLPDEPAISESIIGEWQLSGVSTKAVTFAGQTVDVYLAFETGGGFTLYQMLGQGRYHSYTGKWAVAGNTLTGTYSSGSSWGSSYTVDITDKTLTLTSDTGGEVDTYVKVSIPDSIKKEAYAE